MSEEKNINNQENQNEKAKINREFKDRIFKYIFGHEKNKNLALSLYNAVSGRNHTSTDDMEITTLNDFLYITMRNDLSFLIDETMNIYEHQSTFSPNIPIRMFLYAGAVYKKYVDTNIGKAIYTSKQQKIPVPKLVCFYNGEDKAEDRMILSLKDAFELDDNTEPDIDVRVTLLNINYGHNRELMDACQPLKEYSWFVDKVRTYTKEYRKNKEPEYVERAVYMAIEEMPSDWILKQFLVEHRSEVISMWASEFNEQELWDEIREAFQKNYQEDIEKKEAEIKNKTEEIQRIDAELQSKNEELQYKNEELQSKKAELQNKNEELQNKNEELQNKNEELQNKNEELQNKNEELQNKDAEIAQLKEMLEQLRK